MSIARGLRTAAGIVLVFAMTLGLFASAQTARADSAREKLIGAWHLVRIDTPGADGNAAAGPQPKGMLIYTRDGHVSVQLMYPKIQHDLNNQYVHDGYEASFGTYDVDETTHTLTHHVQGSNTEDLLVGKDLRRTYQFTKDGRLIIRSTRSDEHWSVLWEHY
jgi:hypothetical protein